MKYNRIAAAFIIAATTFSSAVSCDKTPTVAVDPPMMGWSSWNAFMIDISDTLIMQQADLMVSSGLAQAGFSYINIDDGFFGFRDADGNMTENPLRFPGGMRPVVDHIHSLGLKAGIYSDAGDNTCGSGHNKDVYGMGAGLWGHEAQDAQLYFNDWNFDFIKIDFCGGRHLELPVKERYMHIREVIDSVASHPVKVNVCRWRYPGTWIPQAGDSWRISGDIFPEWKYVKYIMDKNRYLSAYAGDGKYNDMDMLVVGYGEKASGLGRGEGLTFSEEEAHFGLWCIMSSPLMLGCDLAYLPEDTRELVTNPELLAVNQDPLGLQAKVVWHSGEGYVYAKDLKVPGGPERAVAFYNPSDEEMMFDVATETLGFEGEVAARDLIRRKDLESSDGRVLHICVPAHYALVTTISGKRAEQKVYEAEWGFIPAFNDVGLGGAWYADSEGASCGAVVKGLGGSEDNCLQWKDIRMTKAGRGKLAVRYHSDSDCEAVLTVNGKSCIIALEAGDGFRDASADIKFKRGENLIEISSPSAELPAEIDCISISR